MQTWNIMIDHPTGGQYNRKRETTKLCRVYSEAERDETLAKYSGNPDERVWAEEEVWEPEPAAEVKPDVDPHQFEPLSEDRHSLPWVDLTSDERVRRMAATLRREHEMILDPNREAHPRCRPDRVGLTMLRDIRGARMTQGMLNEMVYEGKHLD